MNRVLKEEHAYSEIASDLTNKGIVIDLLILI